MSTNRERNGRYAKRQRVGLYLIGMVVCVAGIIAGLSGYFDRNYPNLFSSTTEYVQEVKEVIVETTPEWAEDPDAVEAAQAVIKKKELEAQLAELEASRAQLVTEYDQKLAAVDAQIEAVATELTAY